MKKTLPAAAVALLAALALLPLAPACGKNVRGEDQYNVILISLDTLRADHLQTYGYERETSPNIEAFGERSVVFEEAWSAAPKTAPSHMSIFTGLDPEHHGVMNLDVDGKEALSIEIPTLAMILRDEGYRTAAYHGGGHVGKELGFNRGFEEFKGSRHADVIFERGIEAARDFKDEPFFLFLHTYEIHDPYTPPDEYRTCSSTRTTTATSSRHATSSTRSRASGRTATRRIGRTSTATRRRTCSTSRTSTMARSAGATI